MLIVSAKTPEKRENRKKTIIDILFPVILLKITLEILKKGI